jgi:hypothetical protein|tara:strand:+ start:664 stop:930 length:267 start_codon:yes stop_codon:yes gene_type:complete
MASKLTFRFANQSEVFNKWCQQVDRILSDLPENTITGMPTEYSDEDFQNCMKKLQQTSLNFEEFPLYPINEKIAAELCHDHLKGLRDE